ncbi:hypothetical protein EV426DRAFT_580628, partial [Tirmania nivea]
MPRNRKANRPRYETPDPGQLPTPKQTPGVGSSAKKGLRKSEEQLEQERQEREIRKRAREQRERGGDTDDELGIGPWEAKGNPVGYLDCEDEEMFDEWSREDELKVFCKMGHVVRLVEGVGLEEAPPGTGLIYVQAILGKDGSVAFEGRDESCEKLSRLSGRGKGFNPR